MYLVLPNSWVNGDWNSKEPWESETGAQKVVVVETMEVQPSESVQAVRFFSGVLQAKQSSKLSFQRIGKLESIQVEQGDSVKKGQSIAKLDSRRLQTKLLSLQSQWKQAKAVLAELVAGPRKEVIDSQKATVEDLKAQVNSAKALSERRNRLVQKSAVSTERAEQAKFSLTSVTARYQAAVRELERLLAGTRKEKIDAQKAEVERLGAAVRDVELEIELSELVAPYDGFITNRTADTGTVVAPGQMIFELIEDADVEAWVGVPSEFTANLKKQQALEVLVSGELYSCSLKSIVPRLNSQTLTQSVVLIISDQGPQQMAPGTVVRLKIPIERKAEGFWVPVTALLRQGEGLWAVYTVGNPSNSSESSKRNGTQLVHLKDVEVLQTLQNKALVKGSLQAGDMVVADGIHRLTPGQAVNTDRDSDSEEVTPQQVIPEDQSKPLAEEGGVPEIGGEKQSSISGDPNANAKGASEKQTDLEEEQLPDRPQAAPKEESVSPKQKVDQEPPRRIKTKL